MSNIIHYCEKGERKCRDAKNRARNSTVCMYYANRGMDAKGIGVFELKECPRKLRRA